MNFSCRILISVVFLFSGMTAHASKKEDSLKALLPTARDTQKIKIYTKLGFATENFSDAKVYFSKAFHIADSLKNDRKIFQCYSNQGQIYEKFGELDTAMKFYFAALYKANSMHDSAWIGDMTLAISWLYFELNKYDLAEQYGNSGLVIFQKLNDKSGMANAFNNLATYKKEEGKYDEAIAFHEKALALRLETHDAGGLSHTYNNIGLVYLKMKKYPEAIEWLEKSYHIKDSLRDVKGMAGSLINISNVYLETNDYKKALDFGLRGTKLADSSRNSIFLKNGYEAIADAYKGLKQFELALTYTQKYIDLKEKMLNESNLKQVNELQAKYESDQQEQKIAMLNVKSNLQETELAKNKVVIYAISVGIFLLVILAGLILRNNRVKKRTLEMISSIRDKLELKNQEISDSINYAKNIQKSLLPDAAQLSEVFLESFVLNLPKDIVSGDFFSLSQKDGKAFLGVADCTGHGVPGAFISMIGTDKLNFAIQESKTGMPGEILARLNHAMKSLLHQHEQNMLSKDGMDIALLCFDTTRKKVFYAGANRPLWIIRDGKIIETKPSKTSIGGTTDDDFVFANHEIPLEKDDILYLFSDGYADQFGGVKGKKLMTRNFRDLLLNNYRQPLALQKDFLFNSLKEWQGKFEQVDDILVVGMKV